MKYWAYLIAKLAVVAGFLLGLRKVILVLFPKLGPDAFGQDLFFTFVMLGYWLIAVGLLWAAFLDQRYRCRTCLRRLRMPIHKGSWNHILLGAPRTEYICLFGHGTLTVAELQITGLQNPDWEPHEDIWTELYALHDSDK